MYPNPWLRQKVIWNSVELSNGLTNAIKFSRFVYLWTSKKVKFEFGAVQVAGYKMADIFCLHILHAFFLPDHFVSPYQSA